MVEWELHDHVEGERQPGPVTLHLRLQRAFDGLDTKASSRHAHSEAAFDRQLDAGPRRFGRPKAEDLQRTQEQRPPAWPDQTQRQHPHVREERIAQDATGHAARGCDRVLYCHAAAGRPDHQEIW